MNKARFTMRPETIERRRREREAEETRNRELFLATYTQARIDYPELPDMPAGSRYSDFLPDGRCVIISADRITVF